VIHRGSLRAALGLLVAGAVLLLAHGAVPGAQAVTSNLPTFGQPTISGIQGMGFEQNLRLDPTNPNRVYTSAPGSASSDTSWIWHSEDGGKTFKWVPAGVPTQGKVISCPGGGDTELAVDNVGHLYFIDLYLLNFSTARSDNGGTTFKGLAPGTDCNPSSIPDAVVDRQWYATDGDPTNGGNIYLASNQVGRDQPVCGTSNQGNNVLTVYRSPLPLGGSSAGVQFAPGYTVTEAFVKPCGEGIMGNVEVSPKSRRIFVIHDNAFLDAIAIARCSTVSFLTDPRGLTCVDLPVASFEGYRTAGNFPQLAIDKNGNLYAVWEQAPIDDNGYVVGDTVLKYSYSTDEGSHWSTPITIPTPGLHNNVYAWAAAGDDGQVDIAWYGTTAVANDGHVGLGDGDPNCGHNGQPLPSGDTGTPVGGPDAVTNGLWSVYFTQTLNGHAASPTFTLPIQASQHYVHKGSLQTILGGLCGQRWLGDFLQMRIGSKGEAHIAYADSNNIAGTFLATHAMYVRQNGGTSTSTANPTVSGDPILINAASDPPGDGRFDASGVVGANMPNLDILDSSMSKPAAADCNPAGTACYRVTMTVSDLRNLGPAAGAAPTDTVLRWLTQWLVPASPDCTNTALQSACASGGKNFHVYAESNNGADAKCYFGENATAYDGFTVGPMLTYPGTAQVACSVSRTAPGAITIDVPIAQVSLPDTAPLDDTLYSVTASTMTQAAPTPDDPLSAFFNIGVGGVQFNLVDVVRGYNANFTTADLSVAMTDSPDPVKKDKPLTYTITVNNGGPANATGVTLTDKLPPGVQLKLLKTSQGSCTSAKANNVITATCALGNMANAASATVTITIAHLTAGTMTNTASVAAQSPGDPNAANSSATATTTVTR
jgi:uncharacterized repeat protein (TIGR01451 family)